MSNDILNSFDGLAFSTDHVQENERFDYWYNVICDQILNVTCEKLDNRGGFNGYLGVKLIEDIKLAEIHSDATSYRRTKRHIASINRDSMLLTVRLGQNVPKVHGASRVTVQPNDVNIYHCGREQQLEVFESVNAIVMDIPVERLKQYHLHPEDLHGFRLGADSPFRDMMSMLLKSITTQSKFISKPSLEKLVDNFLRFLAVVSEERTYVRNIDCADIKDILLLNIIEFIRSHIQCPDLSPQYIARCKKISLRYLYIVFESYHLTPSQLIQEERLKRVSWLLKNTNNSVSNIAMDSGFNNLSHFSRLFKAKFGMPPREYRLGSSV